MPTDCPVLIFYHKNCPDGIAASWVFLRYMALESDLDLAKINCVPLPAGKLPTDIVFKGKEIILLDLCWKREDIFRIASEAKSILVLDHHSSAISEVFGNLPDNVTIVLDTTRSAVQIAWDRWFPQDNSPWFIDVIADRDLWKWKIPLSKEIGEYLHDNGFYSHTKMTELLDWTIDDIENAAKEGTIILKEKEKTIQMITKKAILCDFYIPETTYKVYLTECPHEHASEVGHRLSTLPECDFAVMWRYSFLSDEWELSCRSSKNRTDIDLSTITKNIGGGGHVQAAGFIIKPIDSPVENHTINKNTLRGNLRAYFKYSQP
jgi:nanoRNase/pAp phosphatase (c-di-AMP/oligoRNAs hydrolase)